MEKQYNQNTDNKFRRTEKIKKIYPKDTKITSNNAIFEMAKDIREIRNFIRELSMTSYGRVRVASWATGMEFRELLKVVKGIAQTLKVKGFTEELKSAKEIKEKEAKSKIAIETH